MKDSPFVPFWMPFVVLAIVAVVLGGLGVLLLNIAVATGDMFAIHSMAVIIVALVISLVIAGGAAIYANTGSKHDSH